jgi:hypothetical protein
LYPKNLGYQFGGYTLDEQLIPTFQYRSGTLEIKDCAKATHAEERQQLKRVLQFDSPTEQAVWFRALTGDLKQESDRVYRSGKLRLTIPQAETMIRTLSEEPKRSELLLRLQLPKGKSSLEFVYEPIQK